MLLLSVSCAVILSGLELWLRANPQAFGARLGNHVFSRYGTFPGAIYFFEPTTRINFMWPDFTTRAYFNGYFWRHSTDGFGFRNPPNREKRVLLLGDSLIYGHGVDDDAVVAHVLERDHGIVAYNMSRQGDCLYQHYVNLRLHLEAFESEVVVLFVFRNDFRDLEIYRTTEEIIEMPELERYDYAAIGRSVEEAGLRKPGRLSRLPAGIAVLRFIAGVRMELQARLERLGTTRANESSRVFEDPILDEERFGGISAYYARILGDLARRADAHGAELLLIHLDLFPEDAELARQRATEMLRATAAANGIAFFDTGELFGDCVDCRLRHDGHFAPKGHRVLARFVDQALRSVSDGRQNNTWQGSRVK